MSNTENKCCGIKILDLDDKRSLVGNEYLAIAEKDNNFKTPVNQVVELLLADPRIKQYIEEALGGKFSDLQNQVTQQLNNFNQQLNEFKNTLNSALDSKYNELKQKLDQLEQKLNGLTGDLNDLGDQFDNFDVSDDEIINIVNTGIQNHKVKILDPVQTAINSGQGISQPMPSANNYKILLDTWTGTMEAYNALQSKVDGMTYNIIDEEEE